MDQDTPSSPPKRVAVIDWLLRVNGQVGSWVASMSWWRLVLLFIIIMVAGGIISDQLRLQHDKVKVVRSKDKNVDVMIGGSDGIHIIRRHSKQGASAPAESASGAVSSPSPSVRKDGVDIDIDEDDLPRQMTRTAYTFAGFIGDLGSALIVIAF